MQDLLVTVHDEAEDNDVPVASDGELSYCLYRSMARPGLEREDLDVILETSRERNRAHGLTGCLHHEDGLFFQWLEGPRMNLFRLLDRLREDDRHLSITVLDQGPLKQRLFQDWQMRFSDHSMASLLDWLAEHGTSLTNDDDQTRKISAFLQSVRL